MASADGVYVQAFMLCSEPPAALKGGHVVRRADQFHFSGDEADPSALPLSVFILAILATDDRTAATLSFQHTTPMGTALWLSSEGRKEWPIYVSRNAHNLVVPWSTNVTPGAHELDLFVDGVRVSRLFFTVDYAGDRPLAN